MSGIPQVTFQVLAPKFSEMWFDEKSRTTATMVLSIGESEKPTLTLPVILMVFVAAFHVGNAIGQLISPAVKDVRKSVCSFLVRCQNKN